MAPPRRQVARTASRQVFWLILSPNAFPLAVAAGSGFLRFGANEGNTAAGLHGILTRFPFHGAAQSVRRAQPLTPCKGRAFSADFSAAAAKSLSLAAVSPVPCGRWRRKNEAGCGSDKSRKSELFPCLASRLSLSLLHEGRARRGLRGEGRKLRSLLASPSLLLPGMLVITLNSILWKQKKSPLPDSV